MLTREFELREEVPTAAMDLTFDELREIAHATSLNL